MKTIIMVMTAVMLVVIVGCGSEGTSESRIKYLITDENYDGTADSMFEVVYGDDNYMSGIIKYSCSGLPRLSSEDCTSPSEDYRYSFTRDSEKKIVSMVKTEGVDTDSYELTYDGNGHISAMAIDLNSDSTTDMNQYFTTDSSGNITRAEVDADGDALYDSYALITYYLAGKPYHYEFDQDNDGTIDYRKDFGYDADANLVSCADDNDNDADYDDYKTYLYTEGKMTEIAGAQTDGGATNHMDYLQYEDGKEKGTEFMWIYIKLGLFF